MAFAEMVSRIFSEKISTRIKVRPEFETALKLCTDIKGAAPDQAVILVVHEMKRLARNAAELMTLAATLQEAGIQLELLTGPLVGVYDPQRDGLDTVRHLGRRRPAGSQLHPREDPGGPPGGCGQGQ
ncbi:recombinase family protein [Microtetraspora glauca]|uniref:Recombinase family protein n=1 Tax=Microtetraspora glauca TaxID=1996 RepID=A0ABV3GKG1_MICGL